MLTRKDPSISGLPVIAVERERIAQVIDTLTKRIHDVNDLGFGQFDFHSLTSKRLDTETSGLKRIPERPTKLRRRRWLR